MESKYDEKKVERIFWYISLIMVIISPLAIISLYKGNLALTYNSFWLTVIIFSGIPLALFNDFVVGLLEGNLKFWIVRPSSTSQYNSSLNLELTFHEVISRLKSLKFIFTIKETTPNFIIIDFSKTKDDPASKFLDSAFRGTIKLTAYPDLTDIFVQLTFLDTIVIETGELTNLKTLCNYLSLKVKDYKYSHVPLITYAGLDLALLTILLSLFYSFYPSVLSYVIASSAFGAIGFALFSIGLIYFDRQYLFGYRLALVTIYLASIPFIIFSLGHFQIFN